MHIKEKVTGLWARRPRLSGTQGRALKGVTQFFAAMLVCTMIARGTAGATLAVVQTASPRRGELVQGLTADAALSAGEVQNVKAPRGWCWKNISFRRAAGWRRTRLWHSLTPTV